MTPEEFVEFRNQCLNYKRTCDEQDVRPQPIMVDIETLEEIDLYMTASEYSPRFLRGKSMVFGVPIVTGAL